MHKKQTAVILQHSGGELANQLWNYLSIYAYALERDLECENPSFFEYAKYFPHTTPSNLFIKYFFYLPFLAHHKRRNSVLTQTFRFLYKWYVTFIKIFYKNNIISTREQTREKLIYLPPSKANEKLTHLEHTGTIYFDGWLFRNPVGIRAHHTQIKELFLPHNTIQKRVREIIGPLKQTYTHLIGVHIRQDDYQQFKGGKFFISQSRVREILDQFLHTRKLEKSETLFLITSDGTIDPAIFSGLHVHVSQENAVTDLFLLTETEVIIGSDSTFGDFAAYYADVPHIIFEQGQMDWTYYENKTSFFENKYCTMMQY